MIVACILGTDDITLFDRMQWNSVVLCQKVNCSTNGHGLFLWDLQTPRGVGSTEKATTFISGWASPYSPLKGVPLYETDLPYMKGPLNNFQS